MTLCHNGLSLLALLQRLALAKGIVELEQRIQAADPVIFAIRSASAANDRGHAADPFSLSRRTRRADLFAYDSHFHAGFDAFLPSHAID